MRYERIVVKFFAAAALASSLSAQPLLVAAASDLQPLQQDLAKAWGRPVRFVFGASGILARQIAAGAPFDLFLSADERRVRDLATAGKLDGVTPYGRGRLSVWSKTPKWRNEPISVLTSQEIKHIAIANPAHAPYGAAAKEALERLGLWSRVESKLVYAESVRQAFQFAESGNAEIALVSWTLVKDLGGKPVPPEAYTPLQQAGGVVRGAKQAEEARKFLNWLVEGDGRLVLERFGFDTKR